VDDRSGRQVVDDVAQGARIVRLRDGYIDEPDAEPCGCGAAGSWVEATALAAGLKIPPASVSMMTLIERRTFPPVTGVNCARATAGARAGPAGMLQQRD
jgi:hypothetical protein